MRGSGPVSTTNTRFREATMESFKRFMYSFTHVHTNLYATFCIGILFPLIMLGLGAPMVALGAFAMAVVLSPIIWRVENRALSVEANVVALHARIEAITRGL